MATCSYCRTTILFGGQQVGSYRFCNQKCASKGAYLQIASRIPAEVVQQHVWAVHHGLCPICKGSGPVDVHTSYRIYSVLIMTSWRNQPRISCRSCGVKAKLGDMAVSLVAGWWGFPWGLIMTPVQVGRNLIGIVRSSESMGPSAQLETTIRTAMAERAVAGATKAADA